MNTQVILTKTVTGKAETMVDVALQNQISFCFVQAMLEPSTDEVCHMTFVVHIWGKLTTTAHSSLNKFHTCLYNVETKRKK